MNTLTDKAPQLSTVSVRPARPSSPSPARAAIIRSKFFSRVDFNAPNGCWIWTGLKSEKGYGLFYNGEKTRRATHYALSIEGIEVPKGMMACHKCDVSSCVNPDHLYVGTVTENNHDKILRGRPSGKLSLSDVREILRDLHNMKVSSLAEKYGVSSSAISRIKNGKGWALAREAKS